MKTYYLFLFTIVFSTFSFAQTLKCKSFNLDASMISIGTNNIIIGHTAAKGTVQNYGSTNINELSISWRTNQEDIYTTTFDELDIASGDTYSFICGDSIDLPIGDYDLQIWINSVNGIQDEFISNDSLMKEIHVACFSDERRTCFEEFTSSTSSPCSAFNEEFNLWAEANADDITLVKYQMNWPEEGDLYYTQEAGDRKEFYEVITVPNLFIDGNNENTTMESVASAFEESQLQRVSLKTWGVAIKVMKGFID